MTYLGAQDASKGGCSRHKILSANQEGENIVGHQNLRLRQNKGCAGKNWVYSKRCLLQKQWVPDQNRKRG